MSNVSFHNRQRCVRKLLNVFVLEVALCLAACGSPAPASSQAVVSQRLARYAELLHRQDAAALSGMFEPSGSMVHQGQPPVVGRAAIQAFLESFAGYKVLSHQMQVDSFVARGSTVEQTGTYAQAVLTPEGRTLEVAGKFAAVWRQEQDGTWLIQSMRTAPASGS